MFARKPGKGITLEMYIRNTQVNKKKKRKVSISQHTVIPLRRERKASVSAAPGAANEDTRSFTEVENGMDGHKGILSNPAMCAGHGNPPKCTGDWVDRVLELETPYI